MHIMESRRPFIPMYMWSGIKMTRIKNQGRWMVVSNRYSPMRDTFFLSSLQGFLYFPMCPYYSTEWDTLPHIILTSGENRISVFLIPPKLKMMHVLILFFIHEKLNLINLLIWMGPMLTGIFSKILIFNTFILIPMMKTMTS